MLKNTETTFVAILIMKKKIKSARLNITLFFLNICAEMTSIGKMPYFHKDCYMYLGTLAILLSKINILLISQLTKHT